MLPEEQEREADPLDIATRNAEIMLADQIRVASKSTGPRPTGFCLSPDCGEQLIPDEELEAFRQHGFPKDSLRFCGAPCRDRLDQHMKMLSINGRRG
jgi:hypothetical protein